MYKESPYSAMVPPQSREKKRREMEMMKGGRQENDEEEVILPGFRFHPTDEELVGFYLRRKVEKKPPRIELIKQIDIYKFDPWDLSGGSNVGDKEHYFFCLRGRKYRNSIRPNRVTGSGFWKATGIDRQIYSLQAGKTSISCIGLKKSLVYYKGSAGKGTKTDWMMHEYRLPDDQKDTKLNPKSIQEMEVWTICRIFKRNSHFRKFKAEWREMPSIKPTESNSKACSSEPLTWAEQSYLKMPGKGDLHNMSMIDNFKEHDQFSYGQFSIGTPYSSYFGGLYKSEDWDELGAVVDTALNPTFLSACTYY